MQEFSAFLTSFPMQKKTPKTIVSDKPSVTWGVTSVADEDVGVGTSRINDVSG